jgi:carboxylesterase
MTSSAAFPSAPSRPGTEAWSALGSGPRARSGVLLVHGFRSSPLSLRPLAEALAGRGFTVDLPRLPGHGTHFRDMLPTRYEDWRAHVATCARALAERTEQLVLVGLSMGGTLALDIASSGALPVAGVVTINAQILDRAGIVVKLGSYLEKILPAVPAAVAGLATNDINKPDVRMPTHAWVPSKAGNSLLRALPRVREQLQRMPCPVLVMYSRNDHSVSPENSRALLELVRAPRVEGVVLERSFHVATLDYDQPLILERVTTFVDGLSAPPS